MIYLTWSIYSLQLLHLVSFLHIPFMSYNHRGLPIQGFDHDCDCPACRQRSTIDTSDTFQRLKNVLSFWRWVMTSRCGKREKTQCYKVHRWSVFKVCSSNRLTSKCVCHSSAYLISLKLNFFTCKMEVIMCTTQGSCEDCPCSLACCPWLAGTVGLLPWFWLRIWLFLAKGGRAMMQQGRRCIM